MTSYPNRGSWTYDRQFAASWHDTIVTVPDQVAENQREFDLSRRTFPGRINGTVLRFRLESEAYGRHMRRTAGMRISRA